MKRSGAKETDLRTEIASNQEIVDALNAKLARKTAEVRIIQQISSGVLATLDLRAILRSVLETLDELLGFKHAMILLSDERRQMLTVADSRGYEGVVLGTEIPLGVGPLGVVARKRRIVRLGSMQSQLAYQSALRAQLEPGTDAPAPSAGKLPGLPGAQSQIAVPLVVMDDLIGVFTVESEQPSAFDELDEMLLTIVGNQVANAISNARKHEIELQRANDLVRLNQELSRLNASLEGRVEERTSALSSALASVTEERNRSGALLMRLAPPEVIPDLLADRLNARRIPITVMFTDLVGFTSYSSGLEPDEVFSQLNALCDWAGEIIQRYRGYVNKTIGDAVMALFGVPAGNYTHATDAVLAALTLQRELYQKFALPMRIGINSGHVTAGMLGARNKALYDVLGDTVNVASRMEHNAEPGTVAISEETYLLVKPYFEIESKGECDIKGKGMMTRYCVKGIKSLAADPRRVDPTSILAREYRAVADEVYEFRRRNFPMIDFVSLQSRDGSLGHNESVACYATALYRFLSSREAWAADGTLRLKEIQPERLLRIALLHDLGKHALDGTLLNGPCPGTEQKAALRSQLLQCTQTAVETLGLADLAPCLDALYRLESGDFCNGNWEPEVGLVAIADIYDALTAPKLYKGNPWRITGALEELLRLPICEGSSRVCFEAFVELMKPEDARISLRSAEKPLFW
jgi:adenylate cyclase